MTPTELRALAEKLFVAMSFHDPDSGARKALIETVAYLRAQADAQPVAWRDHVEQRIRGWRQRTMNRSGDRLALDDMMGQDTIDDLIDYVCDEWSDPAPAAPQAEPKRGINWQPIETAPRDNKRPLLLASFDDRGVLSNVDFNGSWECESESWEMPQEYYFWDSANGMADEPTHWAYQPEGFAQLTKETAVPQAEPIDPHGDSK